MYLVVSCVIWKSIYFNWDVLNTTFPVLQLIGNIYYGNSFIMFAEGTVNEGMKGIVA